MKKLEYILNVIWKFTTITLLSIICYLLYSGEARVTNNGGYVRARINDTVDVYGTVDVDNPVEVYGTVDIGNTVEVYGTVDIGNTVDVSGSVDIGNTVDVSGSVDIGNTVEVYQR